MTIYAIRFTNPENEGYLYRAILKTQHGKEIIQTAVDFEDAWIISDKDFAVSKAEELQKKYNAECIVEKYNLQLVDSFKVGDFEWM